LFSSELLNDLQVTLTHRTTVIACFAAFFIALPADETNALLALVAIIELPCFADMLDILHQNFRCNVTVFIHALNGRDFLPIFL
jgi:hypothetical protein